MNVVEKARAAAAALNELADALSRGEHLQPAASPPPAPPPPLAPASTVIAKMGRHKGEVLSALPTADLKWYADTLMQSVTDPAKAKWRQSNEADLAAARAELARRG